jgi:hypothetical protein
MAPRVLHDQNSHGADLSRTLSSHSSGIGRGRRVGPGQGVTVGRPLRFLTARGLSRHPRSLGSTRTRGDIRQGIRVNPLIDISGCVN